MFLAYSGTDLTLVVILASSILILVKAVGKLFEKYLSKDDSIRASVCINTELLRKIERHTQELWDIHLGEGALDADRIPKWYVDTSLRQKVAKLHESVVSFIEHSGMLENYCTDCHIGKCIIHHWVVAAQKKAATGKFKVSDEGKGTN